MTTEAPHAVWLLIDRRARLPRLVYPKLEIVRASGAAREYGVETQRIEGVDVHSTTPAKTVADCFRFRRHVGMEVALAALKDYLGKRLGSIDLRGGSSRPRVHGHSSLFGSTRLTTKTPPKMSPLRCEPACFG